MNKLLLVTAVGAVPVAWAALPPAPFDLERDVACLMPEGTLVYAEAPGLPDLCEQGFEHPLIKTILASPLGDVIQREAGMPLPFALGMLNLWAGRPVLPTVAKLTSGGVAVGVLPNDDGAQPTVCVVARGDAAEWDAVIEEVMERVAEARELPLDRVVPPHREIRGMDVWLLGDVGAMALKDGLFVGATDEEVLRRMIDLGAEEGLSGLAAREEFDRARRDYKSDQAFIWGWLDLAALDAITPGDGMQDLRDIPHAPAAQLLLGPSIANLGGAQRGVVEVRFGGDRIELDLIGVEVPGGAHQELLAPADSIPPALPAPRDGETVRGIVYRDLATVFRQRVELFPVEAQPGFADATSNLALFFGGQDITDEVLPALDPWIGIVSRPLEYDERAVPDLPLPGAALLLRTHEESLGTQLVSAVQTILSIINIEAAQNQQPVLSVKLEVHDGVTITYGQYRTPAEGEGVDIRYNLEPACAQVGDTFVLGTHRALVRDLVSQLVAGDLAPPAGGEVLELSGPEVARVIEANEEALVVNSVLNDGKSEADARKEIRGLAAVAGMVEALKLETARPAARDLRASLKLLIVGGDDR